MAGTELVVEGLPNFRVGTLRAASSTAANSLEGGFEVSTLQNGSVAYVLDQSSEYRWIDTSVAAPSDPTVIIPLGQALATPGRWLLVVSGDPLVYDQVIASYAELLEATGPAVGDIITMPDGLSWLFVAPVTVPDPIRIQLPATGFISGRGDVAPLLLDNTPQQGVVAPAGSDLDIINLYIRSQRSSALGVASGATVRARGCRFQSDFTSGVTNSGTFTAVACRLQAPVTELSLFVVNGIVELSTCDLSGALGQGGAAVEIYMFGGSIGNTAARPCAELVPVADTTVLFSGTRFNAGAHGVLISSTARLYLTLQNVTAIGQAGAGLVRRAGASDGAWLLNGCTVIGAASAVELDAATDVPANGGLTIFADSMQTTGAAYVNFGSTSPRVNIKGNISGSGLITETPIVP